MFTPRFRAIALAASLVILGACSSTSSRTGASADTTTSLLGDTTTSSATGAVTTVDAATVSTSSPAPATAAPTVAPTLAPTAAPTTKPPTTAAPATAPPATAAPGPKITSFSMVPSGGCGVPPAPDVSFTVPPTNPPTLKITWTATGADSVYVAIDNKDGIYAQGLPLSGSYDLNFNCGGTHTYWVVAIKGGVKDYKSTTFP